MKYLKQHKKKAHQTGIPKEMPFLIRELKLSRHSKKRMQQRGIPKEVPFLIKEYGESINTHEDKKYFCNKKTVKKIIRLENGKSILKRFDPKGIIKLGFIASINLFVKNLKPAS